MSGMGFLCAPDLVVRQLVFFVDGLGSGIFLEDKRCKPGISKQVQELLVVFVLASKLAIQGITLGCTVEFRADENRVALHSSPIDGLQRRLLLVISGSDDERSSNLLIQGVVHGGEVGIAYHRGRLRRREDRSFPVDS